jgi:hypothetical protein
VYSRASRLVDHDQGLVLVGNIEIPRWNSRLRRALGSTDGRYAQGIAKLESVFGADASFVHPYFTTTQDAIDMALGYPFGDLQQKVVDALSVGLVANLKPGNRIFA